MRGWRRRIFLVLLAYAGAMVLWASTSWTDTEVLVTPAGAPQAFAQYRCPPVFGTGPRNPAPTEETQYRPAGRPCGEQGKHRVLFFVDLAATGAGMLLIYRSGARNRAATALNNASPVEVSGA